MRNCLTSLQSSIAGTVFFVILVFPQRAVAASQNNPFSPPSFFTIQAQEAVEYFFAFKIENKVAVLEKQAEKRLVSAQEYALQGNDKKTQNSLQNYLKIKERQTQLLGKLDDENDLKTVTDSTIEQQKVLETIKTKTNSDPKWLGREDFTALLFKDKIWVFGGMNSKWKWTNDIWFSSTTLN